jgi:DNA-binding LacI/PurR family transcriptional regulator
LKLIHIRLKIFTKSKVCNMVSTGGAQCKQRENGMKHKNQLEGTDESREQKVTLDRVAEYAEVSVATVSRVARGMNGVSRELRERVFHAASRLGVNLEERASSKAVAFLLSNREVLHSIHSEVLLGVEACCASRDYGVLFLTIRYPHDAPARNLHVPNLLCQRELIRGAVVAGTNSQNLLDFLTSAGIPFVVLGNNLVDAPLNEQYNMVYFDDLGGARDLTLYLQSLGHRHIWYMGNCRLPWFTRRREGYEKAMADAGIAPHVLDLDLADPETLGYLATKSILNKGEPVTALFAGDDTTAQGAYRALQECGLRIPEDISVAGFNDTLQAEALRPPLTSVRVFADLVGRSMVEILLDHIINRSKPPKILTIPTQVTKRESCQQVAFPLQEVRRATL